MVIASPQQLWDPFQMEPSMAYKWGTDLTTSQHGRDPRTALVHLHQDHTGSDHFTPVGWIILGDAPLPSYTGIFFAFCQLQFYLHSGNLGSRFSILIVDMRVLVLFCSFIFQWNDGWSWSLFDPFRLWYWTSKHLVRRYLTPKNIP